MRKFLTLVALIVALSLDQAKCHPQRRPGDIDEPAPAGGRVTPRPDVIVLENGATTLISTLEDFLKTQGPDETEPAASPAPSQSEIATTTTKLNYIEKPASGRSSEDAPRESLVTTSPARNVSNGRSAKLAIVFSMAEGQEPRGPPPRSDGNATTSSSAPTAAQQQDKEPNAKRIEGSPQALKPGTSFGQHHAPANQSAGKPTPQHWQVKSLLNVTHDYPLAYSWLICGYIWPLMAAITCFTNLMIVFVLTQKDMRTPTNVVLTAIAIFDIIPIVVPVPWFVYLFAMGYEKRVLYPPLVCYFYQHLTRSVSEIFYFLSTWLNVLLAIQDYMAACRPKLAQKYCRIKVVILEIVLLTLLAFLLNLPQALKLVFKPVKFYYQGELTWGCKALQAKWFKDLVGEYVALYDDIFTAIIVVFVDGGPAILLITLTSLLIRQLHRQRIKGHLLMEQARTASKRRRERHRQQEYESSARVMIFVLLAFLAVKIPFATTYTLMIIQSRFEIHFVENLVDFQKAITITDLVFVLSYPINFTIFCCCSKKFRHKCAQLLGECNQNTKLTRERIMSSFPTSLNSDSFLSRRYSSSLVGAGSGRLHRESSVSFILPCEEGDEPTKGGTGGRGASMGERRQNSKERRKLKRRKRFSMPDLISKSSSMSSASTVTPAPKSLHTSPSSSSGSSKDGTAEVAKQPPAVSQQSLGRCEGANHFFTSEQQARGATTATTSAGHATTSAAETASTGDRQQVTMLPSGQEFRRLLGEGSLCLECIMCYERLKRSASLPEPPVAPSRPPLVPAVMAPRPPPQPLVTSENIGGEVVQHAGTFDSTQRRSSQASDSSFSWPALPPAPLEPRSLPGIEQHLLVAGLPQIITTTCESISEQRSSSEGEEDEEGQEEEQRLAEEPERPPTVVRAESNQPTQQQQQPHGFLARQLHLSNESDLNSTTTNEIATPDWSDAGPPRAPHQSEINFGEVDQFQWEAARRRLEQEADAEANKQQQQQGQQQQQQGSHMSGSQSGEHVNERDEGRALGHRTRSQSRDGIDFESVASTCHHLARPREVEAREVSSSAPAEIATQSAGGQSFTGADGPERASNQEEPNEDRKQDERRAKSGVGSRQRSCFEERTTTSEQLPKQAGLAPTNSRKSQESGRLSLSSKFESRQRSLSLSNSNLSTLPNATGMLADVLVSVLFAGQDKDQQQQGPTGGGQAASSKGKRGKLKRKLGLDRGS